MSKAKLIRRSLGGVCLVGAVAMLAAGDTKPTTGTNNLSFPIYWLTCFLLATVAMLMAVLDLFAVRREARREQRSLFQETLGQIQAEKQHRPSAPAHHDHPSRRSGFQPDK